MLQKTYLELGQSKQLLWLLLVTHLGAVLALALADMNLLIKIFLIMVCCAYLFTNLRRHVWRSSPKAIVRVWENEDGSWILENKQGGRFDARLRGDSLRTRFLIILNFSALCHCEGASERSNPAKALNLTNAVAGLLRRFVPRNDKVGFESTWFLPKHVVIAKDALPKDLFRRFYVHIRYAGQKT